MVDCSPIRATIFVVAEHVTVLMPYSLEPLFPEIPLHQRHTIVANHRRPFPEMFRNTLGDWHVATLCTIEVRLRLMVLLL